MSAVSEPARTIDLADASTRVSERSGHTHRVTRLDGSTTIAIIGAQAPGAGQRPPHVEVVVDGWRFELEVEDERRAVLRERARRDRDDHETGGPSEIRAIIPGRVVAVGVTTGDDVAVGDRLFVLEAMKMQNELRASRAGRVTRVAVGEGQTVEAGDLLLVLE